MDEPIQIATSLYLPGRVPTLEQAVAVVAKCADAVASLFLADRGYGFTKASDHAKVGERGFDVPEPLGDDPVGYAAYLYQYQSVGRLLGLGMRGTAKALIDIGDACFYEDAFDIPKKYDRQTFAMYCYQLAAGIAPESEQGAWNAMTVCWQGNFDSELVRFKAALPYAVVVAALNPSRNEVAQVLEMLARF
jgi:hypothetical protein